jgi:hypothetical protein
MLKYILLFLLMPCFAHAEYYTSSQILNKVLVSSTAIKGTLNETQVLNLVYNPNASALNVRLDTNTATSPYVLKTGDVITGTVQISSSTTSTSYMCIAGAFDTLPTSGYNKGCIAYQNSDNTLYVSIENVVSANSWKPVW